MTSPWGAQPQSFLWHEVWKMGLSWQAISGSAELLGREDDYSIQISSANSRLFFVRVLKGSASEEITFTDFNVPASEYQLGVQAIQKLSSLYGFNFSNRSLRLRSPADFTSTDTALSTEPNWIDIAEKTMTEGLNRVQVPVLLRTIAHKSLGSCDLVITTGD